MRRVDQEFGQLVRWLARERLSARSLPSGELVVKPRRARRSRLTGELKRGCPSCGAVGWHIEDCAAVRDNRSER